MDPAKGRERKRICMYKSATIVMATSGCDDRLFKILCNVTEPKARAKGVATYSRPTFTQ